MQLIKILGTDNFSDSLTKHSCVDRIKQTMRGISQDIVFGRHHLMPRVAE